MSNVNEHVRLRKAMLRAKLTEMRGQIRHDVQELKDDLNPLKTAGHMIKNMLKPKSESELTGSPILNFGLDTGLSMLVNRIIPGAGKRTVRAVAPIVIKNVATHVVPKARSTASRFLRWVADKTDGKNNKGSATNV
jgi:hypothetical protein